MQKKGSNISLKGYDDIFSTDQSRAEAQQERVQEIPLSDLHPFEGHPIPTESVRYNDNRVSLYAGQDGKCAITGKKLDVQTCICYRKTNDCKKGNDSYQNLLLLSLQGLAIVNSEDMMSVVALVKEYSLNAKVITKVNKLRATAGLPLLAAK